MIGDSAGVEIPDEYLKTGAPVYVWLFLHTGEEDGETEFRATISVIKRAKPSDEPPTQEERSVVGQAIAALNNAVETTSQHVADAEVAKGLAEDAQAAAESARDDAIAAQTAAETAQGKAETAQTKAEKAQEDSESASAQAEEAKTAAETARTKAEEAQGKAETAQGLAEDAQRSAEAAQAKAEEAQLAAETAESYAERYTNDASLSAEAALESEQNAEASAIRAEAIELDAERVISQADADALKAEGYAIGTQDGIPAGQGSEYYENNAKYFMEACLTATGRYPKIENEYWYVWDPRYGVWVNTGVKANGIVGDTGTTFYPHVSPEGVISWTNDGGKTNPSSISIKGPKGDAYILTDADREEIAGMAADDIAEIKGMANGLAELDGNGKVPAAQLPSYVDDVQEYASASVFPQTGESGKIYVATDTNKTYRWTGSQYTEISESLAIGETASTAFAGNRGKAVEDAVAGKADKVSNAVNGNFAGLDANGNLVDSGHKHSDYLTEHQDIPVQDVQIDGTSILDAQGVANIPYSGSSIPGVVKVSGNRGVQILTGNNEGQLSIVTAGNSDYKAGYDTYKPVIIQNQHQAVFYGLAKAAGDETQSQSSNAVGNYTNEAKTAIQNMLGIRDSAEDALKAEGYAVGEQNGTPVDSSSPYYENNAEHWASEAAASAQEAAGTAQMLDDVALDSTAQEFVRLVDDNSILTEEMFDLMIEMLPGDDSGQLILQELVQENSLLDLLVRELVEREVTV